MLYMYLSQQVCSAECKSERLPKITQELLRRKHAEILQKIILGARTWYWLKRACLISKMAPRAGLESRKK